MSAEVLSVGGVKGVGKTTALRSLQESASVEVVYLSAEINALSRQEKAGPLSSLTIAERDEMRKKHGDLLAKRLEESTERVLLDLHYTDIREDPEKPLQPASLLCQITTFIMMTAPPEVVLQRRLADTTRSREVGDIEKIEAEQVSETNCARSLACLYQRPYREIDANAPVNEVIFSLQSV